MPGEELLAIRRQRKTGDRLAVARPHRKGRLLSAQAGDRQQRNREPDDEHVPHGNLRVKRMPHCNRRRAARNTEKARPALFAPAFFGSMNTNRTVRHRADGEHSAPLGVDA